MAYIPILVIHVRGNQERKAFIQHQLDKLDFPYHYILDGNISDLTPDILDRYFVNDGKPDTMHGPFPRTSCAYKHLLAAKYIIDHQLEGALIVEDDLRFYSHFQSYFTKSIDELHNRYADKPCIVNYEESSLLLVPRSKRRKGIMLYPASRDRFTGCLYINRQAAEVFLDYMTQHKSDTAIDRLHNKLLQEGLLTYLWSHPCLACQCSCDGSMPTMIPTRPRPLKRLRWFYKKIYKHLLYSLR